MTKKIFWQDPYLVELDTTVVTAHKNHVTVKETIFYAFSGGQESDMGTIGNFEVLEAKKNNKEIVYTLTEEHCLKAGDKVKIIIDWRRRYQLMRLHFAAEIVLELVYQQFPGIVKIGAHIAPDKARIDFIWANNVAQLLLDLQAQAQKIVDSNEEIISTFSDEVNEQRYWKIKDFSPVPCGGTHLRRTGEVGYICLKRVNPGKGKERIEIYVS